MSDRFTVAVIGLGSMGLGMAQSCVRAGLATKGQDIDAARTQAFADNGGLSAPLSDLAGSLDAVAIVVLNAAQTEDVLFGADGLAQHLKSGAVVLGCATVPPAFAKSVAARLTERGVHYLDAPISGGAIKAAEGALSIMASGSDQAFAAAKPVLDATASTVFNLGADVGAGSAMKAVNQLLAGVHIATMAEAMAFGMTQGVTPAKFLEVISQCAGTSWMLENRAPHIVDADYTPRSSVNIWPKDLGIVLNIAKDSGFDAPITETALARFKAAADAGLGWEDDAAVIKVYADQAGLTLPSSGSTEGEE